MKKILLSLICLAYLLCGCVPNQNDNSALISTDISENINTAVDSPGSVDDTINEITIPPLKREIDLTDYFQGIEGCAVIYDGSAGEYLIHNLRLSEKRSSPCSTFKIVSTIIGLMSNTLESESTVLDWTGTKYSVNEWNRDQTLTHAFKSSCVWYFREVVDRSGKDLVQTVLSGLSYGNCDISQWEGSGVNGHFDELNGFWLESSLLISPLEQVEVVKRIFSLDRTYSEFIPVRF